MAQRTVVFGLTVGSSAHLLGLRLTLLADAGWTVYLVVGDRGGLPVDVDPRVQVVCIPMGRSIDPAGDAQALGRWLRFLRSARPDIVVAATPKAGMLGMVAARIAGVPRRIYEVWGARWDGMSGRRATFLKSADRLAFGAATESVALSPSLARLVVDSGVARRPPVVLSHWGSQGVDRDRFSPAGGPPGPRPATRPPTMGFVGRVAADKGLAFLQQVLPLVRATVPDAVLRVAGAADPADPLAPDLTRWLTSHPAIAAQGFEPDVPGFLRSIDVLVFPSLREGLPNAVIEAAACGVPTVAWRVTGSIDAVRDGETGYLVDFGDVEGMATRVSQILTDPDLRATLGSSAANFAADRFDAPAVQGDLHAFLTG